METSGNRRGWRPFIIVLGLLVLIGAIVLTERGRRGGVAGNAGVQPRDTIDLSTLGYSHGSGQAPVIVYEFSDFGCPYCAKFALETYPELHREFVATGKVRWTYVPFVMGRFANGSEAARAAECAGEQDEFWRMHDRLFQGQREWKSSSGVESLFESYARELELDVALFVSCYRENRPSDRLALQNYVADALRVRATPTFFINGRLLEGALPVDMFREILATLTAE